jgi:hypothetical protein
MYEFEKWGLLSDEERGRSFSGGATFVASYFQHEDTRARPGPYGHCALSQSQSLFKEKIAVYCENHMKHTNTHSDQNAKFQYDKSAATYSNHWGLKC